jgi:hypothetical protein
LSCHSERSEEPLYFALAVARPLFVIPQRSGGICFFLSCHSERSEEPLYFALAVARPLFVIPQRSGGICFFLAHPLSS